MSNQFTKNYFCKCRNVCLKSSELISHLKLPNCHKISTIKYYERNEKVKTLIMKRIKQLQKVKGKVIKSCQNNIEKIVFNANLALDRINKIMKEFYEQLNNSSALDLRHLIKFDIVCSIKHEDLMQSAIDSYYGQDFFEEVEGVKYWKGNGRDKLETFLEGRSSAILTMKYSEDESIIALGCADGTVRIWDDINNKQHSHLLAHSHFLSTLDLSQNKNILITGSFDSQIKLFSLSTLKKLHTFKHHSDRVYSVILTSDSTNALSCSFDKTITILNLESKTIDFTFIANSKIRCMHLTKLSQMVVSGDMDGNIQFWNLSTKVQSMSLTQEAYITCFAFSSDEKNFYIGKANGVFSILNSENLSLIFKPAYQPHEGEIIFIEISEDLGIFVTSSLDNFIIFWDLNTRVIRNKFHFQILSLIFPKKLKNCCVFSIKNIINCYNFDTDKKEEKNFGEFLGMNLVTISNNMKYVAYFTKNLHLFDLKKSVKVAEYVYPVEDDKKFFNFEHYNPCLLTFSPNGQNLAVGFSFGRISIFLVPSLEYFMDLELFDYYASCICISRDNKFLFAGNNVKQYCTAYIEKNKTRFIKRPIRHLVTKLAIFCGQGEKIAAATDEAIYILDLYCNDLAEIFISNILHKFVVSDNGRYVFGHCDKTRWTCVDTEKKILMFEGIDYKEMQEYLVSVPDLFLASKNFASELLQFI